MCLGMFCFHPIDIFPIFYCDVDVTWTFSVKYTVMWSHASYLCDIYCSIGIFPHGTKHRTSQFNNIPCEPGQNEGIKPMMSE